MMRPSLTKCVISWKTPETFEVGDIALINLIKSYYDPKNYSTGRNRSGPKIVSVSSFFELCNNVSTFPTLTERLARRGALFIVTNAYIPKECADIGPSGVSAPVSERVELVVVSGFLMRSDSYLNSFSTRLFYKEIHYPMIRFD